MNSWRTGRTPYYGVDSLATDLYEQATYYGVKIRDSFYLFEAEDEVPDTFKMPPDLTYSDWSDLYCEECALAIIAFNVDRGYLKVDEHALRISRRDDRNDLYFGPFQNWDTESDRFDICGRCGCDLHTSPTSYAMDEAIECIENNRDSEWWFKGNRGTGWNQFDLMHAARLVDHGAHTWIDSTPEGKERSAKIIAVGFDVLRNYSVTAEDERDARIRLAGQGLRSIAKKAGSIFGKWWDRMTEEPGCYGEE